MPYPSLDTGPDDGVEKWDLTTWETEILPWTCPTGVDYFDAAWAISDHEIIFTTGQSGSGQAVESKPKSCKSMIFLEPACTRGKSFLKTWATTFLSD